MPAAFALSAIAAADGFCRSDVRLRTQPVARAIRRSVETAASVWPFTSSIEHRIDVVQRAAHAEPRTLLPCPRPSCAAARAARARAVGLSSSLLRSLSGLAELLANALAFVANALSFIWLGLDASGEYRRRLGRRPACRCPRRESCSAPRPRARRPSALRRRPGARSRG